MTMNLGICQTELPWGDSIATLDVITKTVEEAKEIGAKSIRMSCVWQVVEPSQGSGNYKFAELDRAIEIVEEAGLEILLIVEPRRLSWTAILGVPMGISASAKNVRDYGNLCGAIAKRYGNRIAYFEIGNEVNNLAAFGSPKDPTKYLALLRAANTNIKKYSDAKVLAGALMAVGTGWPSLHPVEWVKKLYQSFPQDAFDGLSMHPYSTDGVFNPMTPTADNEYAVKNIQLIRQIMDDNGDAAKPIFCSEWGFDSVRSLNGLSTTAAAMEEEQAQNLETQWHLLEAFADAGTIHPTVWIYNTHDQKPGDDAWYRFGQTRYDFSRKPSWFKLKSLSVGTVFEMPTAVATATALAPTVEEYVDPGESRPGAAQATAEVLLPLIGEVLSAPTPTALAEALVPTIEEFQPSVQYVSKGTGSRVTPAGTSSASLLWTHDVTKEYGGLLLVPLVVSTSNLRGFENYLPVVTSSIDGPLRRLGSTIIGSSSVKHGSVHWYGLYAPRAGNHTITATVADAFTGFTAFAGNSILVKNAAGYGTVTAERSSSGGNTPRIKVASAPDRLTLAVFGLSGNFFGLNQTTIHSAGSTVDGDGDYIVVARAPGAGEVTFEDSATNLLKFGVLALDIPQLLAPQTQVMDPPPAIAVATALTPTVGVVGSSNPETATAIATALVPTIGQEVGVTPPTATAIAEALVPTVTNGVDVQPPAAGATAQAKVPIVGENSSPTTASATASAPVPSVTVAAGISMVSVVGVETSGSANTIVLGSHQSGDVLLGANFNSNFTTLPTTPTGWTVPTNGTRNTNNAGSKVAYKVASSSSETSGDWGSAGNAMIVAALRSCSGIGAVSSNGGTTSTLTVPALTLQKTDGSSKVLVFAFISNASGGNLGTAPAGHDVIIDVETGNNCDAAAYITPTGVTSYAGGGTINHTVGAAWHVYAVELLA